MAGVNVPLHACRAFLHRHGCEPGHAARPAGAARAGRVRLLQGGRRQAPGRLLRAEGEALAHRTASPRTACFDKLPDDLDHLARRCWRAPSSRVPMLERSGHPHVLQRPGELHARRALSARRGAGAAAISSSRPASTRSASSPRAAPARRSPNGCMRRRAAHRPLGRRHPPHASRSRATGLSRPTRIARRSACSTPMHWPYRSRRRARGVRTSPLHERLAAAGACFGEVGRLGARRTGSRPTASSAEYEYSLGGRTGSSTRAAEHRAVREARRPVRPDRPSPSSASRAADAEAVLQRICANDVAVAPGRIVYTQWLNERGGIEADLTVTRLAGDRVPGGDGGAPRAARTRLAEAPHAATSAHCVVDRRDRRRGRARRHGAAIARAAAAA